MTIVLFILFMITNDVSFFILLMIFLSLSISMCIYDLVSWVGEPIRNRSQVYWFSDWRYVDEYIHNDFLSLCISNSLVLIFDAYIFFRDFLGYGRMCINVLRMLGGV